MKKGFTLAEVLITLAIIGVVAAISIPSVISNAQQKEFKTGLKKAVSVLNSAITMNIALDGETPYDNGDLFYYLQRHMSVMKSTTIVPWASRLCWRYRNNCGWYFTKNYTTENNSAFYTTDGMRFEFHFYDSAAYPRGNVINITTTQLDKNANPGRKLRCGSYGLANNPNNTTALPCAILVDVNGDRKPYPENVNAISHSDNVLWAVGPNEKKVKDTFTIMVTDSAAVPYGVAAQKSNVRGAEVIYLTITPRQARCASPSPLGEGWGEGSRFAEFSNFQN